MSKKLYVDWSDVDYSARELVDWMKPRRFDCIVGLSRGGLPLAVIASNFLNLPMVPIVWQTRDGAFRDREGLKNVMKKYQNVLIVDDICDSGKTFNEIEEMFPNSSFYALVNKGNELVDFCSIDLGRDNEEWIVFPWEKKERIRLFDN